MIFSKKSNAPRLTSITAYLCDAVHWRQRGMCPIQTHRGIACEKLVDVTGIEPATPCLQSTRLVSTHSFYHFNY
jgi:hypothetical protein